MASVITKSCIYSRSDNISFVEGDGNLYFKPSDNTYGYIQAGYPGDHGIQVSYDIDEMTDDAEWYNYSGIDQNCVSSSASGNPGFTDLGGDDYTLAFGSMAIEAGSMKCFMSARQLGPP